MNSLAASALLKLRVPLGRVIGDNNCAYEAFDVCAVRFDDANGVSGWGFGESAHGGRFRKPVSWKTEMAPETGLRARLDRFRETARGQEPADLLDHLPQPWEPWEGPRPLLAAIRMALWDLIGRQAGLPLHRLLGRAGDRSSAPAYASPCCFPQPTGWMTGFLREKVAAGFKAVKVKVGHPDIEWDMARLRAAREAVGQDVGIAVDANTAWDAPGTLRWMERATREGIGLSYVEDPLDPGDVEGYRLLAREAPLPLVGHDYLPDPETLRPLLDTGALRAIRMRDGIDHARAASRLADEYDLALIGCNTFGEHALQFSLTQPRVERVEFADLGWNDLFEEPVRAAGGCLLPPPGAGFGLTPRADRLRDWRVGD